MGYFSYSILFSPLTLWRSCLLLIVLFQLLHLTPSTMTLLLRSSCLPCLYICAGRSHPSYGFSHLQCPALPSPHTYPELLLCTSHQTRRSPGTRVYLNASEASQICLTKWNPLILPKSVSPLASFIYMYSKEGRKSLISLRLNQGKDQP